MAKIHHTRGVYANGDFKDNGVPTDSLADHIEYNKMWRPGRALFVDGECLNQGYLSDEQVQEAIEKIKTFPIPTRDTQPYH